MRDWHEPFEAMVSAAADTWNSTANRLAMGGYSPTFYLYHRASTPTEWGALYMVHDGETPDPSWTLSGPEAFRPNLTREQTRRRIHDIAQRLPLLPVLPVVPFGPQPKAFAIEPAPRMNPEGRLDAAWVVRRLCDGRIMARFGVDGRDRAEAWLHAHAQPKAEEV